MNCNLNILKQFILVLFLGIILYSCKSAKEISYTPIPEENAIHESMKTDDVRGLISHYFNFPKYRTQIRGYLIYDRTYENESYKKLLEYSELAQRDTFLSEAFNNILRQKEYKILTNLSKCSLNEIAQYYQNHNDEKCFLKPAIKNTLLNELERYDYNSLRELHKAFKETDLINPIDSIYYEAKKNICIELEKQICDYFDNEQEIINEYKKITKIEIQQYLYTRIEPIITDMLDKDLPKEQAKIKQLFARVFKKNINSKQITRIVNNNLKKCIALINENRNSYLNILMKDEKYYGYTINEKDAVVIFKINNPAHTLYKLSEIQNKTDWVGWGFTAASLAANMLSFGTLGNIIDIVDVGRTIKNTKEDIDNSKLYINNFIKELNKEFEQATQKSVNYSFKSINNNLKLSQKKFKTLIYENY